MVDTIVSPATPLFPSAIGIIRISGPKTRDIISVLTKRYSFSPRFAHLVQLYDEDGKFLDEGIVIFYPGPKSYTGEDMAELFVHGNPVLINHIVFLCIKNGARMAQEGEFTKRAFLNGKLSLEKAESVLSLVSSSTINGVKAAAKMLKGEFEDTLLTIRTKLINILSDIEASVDFPEDVDPDLPREMLLQSLESVLKHLQSIYDSWRNSRMMVDGAICIILGKPNVGKSSLFNILVGESRAITSPLPGTTRDYIDAKIDIGGVIIKLVDTAGIRQTSDPIEEEGVRRTIELSKRCDILLCVFDSSSDFTEDDLRTINVAFSSEAELVVLIINKSDIGDVKKYEGILSEFRTEQKTIKKIVTSCANNHNIDEIRATIKDFVMKGDNDDFFAMSSRQVGLILAAIEKTQKAYELMRFSDYLGSILHLRDVLTNIDDIFGKGSSQDIIDEIFKKFCIGK